MTKCKEIIDNNLCNTLLTVDLHLGNSTVRVFLRYDHLLLFLAYSSTSASPCDSYDVAESGAATICYQVHKLEMPWDSAEITCNNNGADLAVIHDQTVSRLSYIV